METSYFPLFYVWVSGSEGATSHKGTKNLDIGCSVDPKARAPFSCVVKRIFHHSTEDANTVWFESLEKVHTPTFDDYCTFTMSHMNTADFNALGIVVGKTFKQGEHIYTAGTAGVATGPHIHVGFAKGKFIYPGWVQSTTSPAYAIQNQVHMWDAVFLKPGTKILGESNPQGFAYKPYWKYAPTYATMAPVANQALKTTTIAVNMRSLPSTEYPVIGKLPINSVVPISEISSDLSNGFKWVKVSSGGVEGYCAIVASATVITVLTPLEQAQKALAEAQRIIESDAVTISALKKEILVKTAELQSYTPVTLVLYEKTEGAK